MHKMITTLLSFFLMLGSVYVLLHPLPGVFTDVAVKETNSGSATDAVLVINQVPVSIEIADTVEKRKNGLSGRSSLDLGTGMLFIMDRVALHGIWMPDMRFAIDIIWLDEDMVVVDIKEGVTPESYPEVFTPIVPAKYVLEVPAGFSQLNDIVPGSSAQLHGTF